ncbi:MAG: HU family DNA-binding protein [Patescibacteria group bacterium]
MTKNELVGKIASGVAVSKKGANAALKAVKSEISNALAV